jgi:uncharacterized Ntn-hydrolase superfamily protein
MTYSIIGRDAETGELGVILQSYYYGCAPRTLLAAPGIGIVVMQMVPEMSYGTKGLESMAAGRYPSDILEEIAVADPGRALRQVAMMNSRGDAAGITGAGCIPESGHLLGENCCAQGAMVQSEKVWTAMVRTFENSTGLLAERLVDAMGAGEKEGGDIRGRRAAAMLVVAGAHHPSWVQSRPIDIRVDDHPDPLSEVERHLELQRHMGAVELAFERALGGDLQGSIDDYAQIAKAAPDDPDVTMRYAIVLAKAGNISGAREQLVRMTRIHRGWAEATGRLVAAGLLPDDDELLRGLPLTD